MSRMALDWLDARFATGAPACGDNWMSPCAPPRTGISYPEGVFPSVFSRRENQIPTLSRIMTGILASRNPSAITAARLDFPDPRMPKIAVTDVASFAAETERSGAS